MSNPQCDKAAWERQQQLQQARDRVIEAAKHWNNDRNSPMKEHELHEIIEALEALERT